MSFVYIDESRHLLHLIYAGSLDKVAAKRLLDEVKAVVGRFTLGSIFWRTSVI